MATTLHSNNFKQSHINSHNATLKKLADKWVKFGTSMPYTELTLAEVVRNHGFYVKNRGEWIGPFNTEIEANDAKAEWAYAYKHS